MSTKLVKMVRREPQFEGAPVTADVHPDEIENYAKAGWEVVEPKIKKGADKKE